MTINSLLQYSCVALSAIGFMFIGIEIRTKFHKSFITFGITLVLFCLFCSFDLWYHETLFQNAAMCSFQQIVFCFIPPVVILHIGILANRINKKLTTVLFIVAAILSVGFLSGGMIQLKNQTIILTPAYNFLMVPYIVVCVGLVSTLTIKNFFTAGKLERKIFFYHLIGIIIFAVCGTVDLYRQIAGKFVFFPIISFTMIGVIGFSIITVWVFSDKLLQLISDHVKLNMAYNDLEEAKTLIALGKSTAIVNHEMKNQLFSIRFYLERMAEDAASPPHVKDYTDKSLTIIKKIMQLNHDLLDLSKQKLVKGKPFFDVKDIIDETIKEKFLGKETCFSIIDASEKLLMCGDIWRMKNAFQGIFNNSFNLGAENITVRLLKEKFILMLVIDDNGAGVSAGNKSGVPLYEYNPKTKAQKMELSMIRASIEANGGHITIITKNALLPQQSGLIYYISLPNYTDTPWVYDKDKDNVVLIKNGLEKIDVIIQKFNNVFVNPHVLEKAEDIGKQFDPAIKILGSFTGLQPLIGSNFNCHVLNSNESGSVYVKPGYSGRDVPFTEYYILNDLLKLNHPNA